MPRKGSKTAKSKKKTEEQVKAKAIEDVYNKYLKDLSILQKKQEKILEEFAKTLENKKLEEIREKLKK